MRTPQSRDPCSKRVCQSFRCSGGFQTAKSIMYTGRLAVAHHTRYATTSAAARLTGMTRISARSVSALCSSFCSSPDA